MSDSDEMVTISKSRYERLLKRDQRLTALEVAGVDNWEWYGDALSSLNNDEEEDD